MKRYMILVAMLIMSNILLGDFLSPPTLFAHDNDSYNSGYYPYYRPYNRYTRHRNYNPVVRRDYSSRDGYAPDGTYHEEDKVVDRHSSYYSRGRNQAITKPRTTVQSWSNSPAEETTRERTTWIGADGRPHSTTITRETTVDSSGDTHTNTHVDLRRLTPKK